MKYFWETILCIQMQFQIFPVCYVLMTRRTTEIYEDVFRFIEKRILKLKPAEFITDFEAAMRKAIRRRYRKAVLRGCWYHYSAAIRKKMVKLNLLGLMKHSLAARTIKVMMQGLPLLPSEFFMQGYRHVKFLAREWNIFARFKKFFAYFDNFWVAEVCFLEQNLFPRKN